MNAHPLDENLDGGLEYAKDELSTAGYTPAVEVGEVIVEEGRTSITVTIDGSGESDEYVATVHCGMADEEFRSEDISEVVQDTLSMIDNNTQKSRYEKVGTITINFETFKKALKRNYLDYDDQWGRRYVLRLYPPFESEMEAEYYESEQGVHYDNNWDEKPLHIQPQIIIHDGRQGGFHGIVEWPTEANTRNALTDDEIEECGGVEAAVEEGREIFWHELKHSLPETFNLGGVDGYTSHEVDIEWVFEE